MKKILFVLLLIVFSSYTAFAQIEVDDKSEEKLIDIAISEDIGFTGQLEQTLQTIRDGGGQAAVIKQVGNNNKAVITQSGVNLFAYILQDGNYLDATLVMEGDNNNAVIKQRGDNLLTDVKLVGSNNDFKLLQAGTHLSNNIKLLDVAGTDILMLQTKGRFCTHKAAAEWYPTTDRNHSIGAQNNSEK